jgi:alpha-tubulin suppressor-like RCC1 family protein
MLAVTQEGELYCWGRNEEYCLGLDYGGGSVSRPTLSPLENVAYISVGSLFNLVILHDGSLYGWGQASSGNLGLGPNNTDIARVPKFLMSGVRHVAAGGDHAIAVKEDGTVWVWGAAYQGQLARDHYGGLGYSPEQIKIRDIIGTGMSL